MTSIEVHWQIVEWIARGVLWLALATCVMSLFRLGIVFKSGREIRVRRNWHCILMMVAMMLYFLADVATGRVGSAVFDAIVFIGWAALYRRKGKDDDKDDDDKDRKPATKVIGEKAKAKLRELSSRLKPAPALRPVPVRS